MTDKPASKPRFIRDTETGKSLDLYDVRDILNSLTSERIEHGN